MQASSSEWKKPGVVDGGAVDGNFLHGSAGAFSASK